jgi:2',3'-cyclic-nucleotide 2'-phosphodiesterase (5'-nucleotidase family)
MVFTLQLLHASDFEAGIPALADAVRFSAILNYFKTASVGTFAVSPTILSNTLTLSSGDNYIPGPFFNASSDPALNNIGGLTSSSAPAIGRADIGILNALGVQASALGNHEFDLGPRQVRDLLRAGSGNPGTNFPYLSTNLNFATEPDLASELAANQTTAEASTIRNKLARSTVITLPGNDGIAGTADDQRIGIVGATTPTLRSISSPGGVGVRPANPTDFAALAAEIQSTVDILTAQGINKIVVLAHMQQLNIERDELAPRLRDVDILIAGGSHTPLLDSNDVPRAGDISGGNYPIFRTSATGQPILVLNTDANYRYVGRLVVEFNDNGVINTNALNNVLNGAFATDEAGVDRVYGFDVNPRNVANANIVAITDALRTIISNKDNTITGKTEFFLNGTRADVRTEETNLGSVSADANLNYAQQIDPLTVISLKNGGGIRDNIGVVSGSGGATSAGDVQRLPPQPNPLAPNKQVGDVSQLDIENSLRFNNGLSLVTVSAAQLKVLLENGVSGVRPGATPGAFPQISGVIFSFDATRPAQVLDANGNVTTPGQRIRSLAITNSEGKVTDILVQDGVVVGDPNRAFRMVTLNFLADGGDGYPFRSFGNTLNRVDLVQSATAPRTGNFTFAADGSEQDALAEYLRAVGTVSVEDTPASEDLRIQNLALRSDGVLSADRSLRGTQAADRLDGNDGADELFGLEQKDRLRGFTNDDLLSGGRNEDKLFGGDGDDTLIGGLGSDLLVGNRGKDVFVLQTGRGRDTIRDFQPNRDQLGLSRGLEFEELTLQQVGGNVIISLADDELAFLRNVNVNRLTANVFTTEF